MLFVKNPLVKYHKFMERSFRNVWVFYLAVLISSVGSLVFTIGIIALLPGRPFSLLQVSSLILVNRVTTVITASIFPDFADRFSPKSILAITELGAFLFSTLLLALFTFQQESYLAVLICIGLKSLVTSFQGASRAKIVKLFSNSDFKNNLLTSSVYQIVTQGATLIAGLVGICFVRVGSIKNIIIFDAITFLLGGVLLLNLQLSVVSPLSSHTDIISGFKKFYHFSKKIGVADLFLALSLSGYWTFNRKISNIYGDIANSYLLSIYGAMVFVTALYVNKLKKFKNVSMFSVLLCISFILTPFQNGLLTLCIIVIIRDFSYWVVFHIISARIQQQVPIDSTAVSSSYRLLQMIGILAFGEMVSASLGQNLVQESFLRAVASLVCFFLLRGDNEATA